MNSGRFFLCMNLSSVLALSACSHAWEALEPLPDAAESSSSAGSSGASSSGGGGASSSSSGASSSGASSTSSSSGAGGAGGCGPLAPSVPACDNVVGAFDSQAQLDADWYLAAGAGKIEAVTGVAVITLPTQEDTVFAATHADFPFDSCSIWVQIVSPAATSDAMVRLSLSNPFASSRYSIGVLDQKLHAFVDNASAFSIPYDASQMRFVRMREEGGVVHYGYSSDGKCWTEIHNTKNNLSGDVEGRIAVTHVPDGFGNAAVGKFDNYCITPP